MSWHAIVDTSIAIVPLAAIILAARIGSRQVREFHSRTHDDSLLAKMTAFSRFR